MERFSRHQHRKELPRRLNQRQFDPDGSGLDGDRFGVQSMERMHLSWFHWNSGSPTSSAQLQRIHHSRCQAEGITTGIPSSSDYLASCSCIAYDSRYPHAVQRKVPTGMGFFSRGYWIRSKGFLWETGYPVANLQHLLAVIQHEAAFHRGITLWAASNACFHNSPDCFLGPRLTGAADQNRRSCRATRSGCDLRGCLPHQLAR